jgi:hypothetical protein
VALLFHQQSDFPHTGHSHGGTSETWDEERRMAYMRGDYYLWTSSGPTPDQNMRIIEMIQEGLVKAAIDRVIAKHDPEWEKNAARLRDALGAIRLEPANQS